MTPNQQKKIYRNHFSLKIIILPLFVLFLGTSPVSAQEWQNICPVGVLLYLDNSSALAGFKYDTVQVMDNHDSVFFSFPRILKIPGVEPFDTAAGSILGKRILKRNDRWLLTTNYLCDSLKIYPYAQLNESWIFSVLSDTSYMKATVSEISEQNILGTLDSVKTIVLHAFNNTNNPIAHPMNDRQIVLSKQRGIVETFDLYLFPIVTNSYSLVGTTYPMQGIQQLALKNIYHFSPGDVFHYIGMNSTDYEHTFSYQDKIIRIILSATWPSDSNSVTYQVHDCKQRISQGYPTYIDDTTYSSNSYILECNFQDPETNAFFNRLPNEFIPIMTFSEGEYSAPLIMQSLNNNMGGGQTSNIDYYYYEKGAETGYQWTYGPLPSMYITQNYQFTNKMGRTYSVDSGPMYSNSESLVYANLQGIIYGSPLFQDCDHMIPNITTSADTLRFPFTAGRIDTLFIYSNISWNISWQNADWLTVDKTSSTGNSPVYFSTLTENPSSASRIAVVSIGGSGASVKTLIIIQAGNSDPFFFQVSTEVLNFPFTASNTDTVDIYSNISWSLTGLSVSWLTVNKTEGNGNDQLVFETLEENPESATRQTEVSLGGDGVPLTTLTLLQAGNPGGVEEMNGKSVRIFPNPVQYIATISVSGFRPDESLNFSLFDLLGREVDRENFSGTTAVFHRNGLPDGIYMLRIFDHDGLFFLSSKLMLRLQ